MYNIFNNAFHINRYRQRTKTNLRFIIREAGLLCSAGVSEVARTLNMPWDKFYVNRVSATAVVLHHGAGVLVKSLAISGRKQATATEDSEFHISYL